VPRCVHDTFLVILLVRKSHVCLDHACLDHALVSKIVTDCSGSSRSKVIPAWNQHAESQHWAYRFEFFPYVWLPRKTRRKSLSLVLSYEQKNIFFLKLFILFKKKFYMQF
jgi:hypothetical protein